MSLGNSPSFTALKMWLHLTASHANTTPSSVLNLWQQLTALAYPALELFTSLITFFLTCLSPNNSIKNQINK